MIGCPPWQIPCNGNVASWLTLVIIVIAPTARSPPYLDKLEVKLIDKILSVDNMTNVDIPRARHGKMISFCSLKFSFLRCRIVFFPDKKRRIHIVPYQPDSKQLRVQLPLPPRWNTKIKIGSRMILITAPITVVIMLIFANPCVVIKWIHSHHDQKQKILPRI